MRQPACRPDKTLQQSETSDFLLICFLNYLPRGYIEYLYTLFFGVQMDVRMVFLTEPTQCT